MSPYTTLLITRTRAKDFLKDKVDNTDDKILERMMEFFLEKELYNCIIVPDDCEEADWKTR